jgi:hypothetical protein
MVQIGNVSVEINNISIESAVDERLISEWKESAWLDAFFIFVGINLLVLFIVVMRHILKNRNEFSEDVSLLLHTNYYTRFIYKEYFKKPFWKYMISFVFFVTAGIVFIREPLGSPMENLAITLVLFVLSWGVLFGFEDIRSVW